MRLGLALIAVVIALGWWGLAELVPRWAWMMDRAGMCIMVGILAALFVDKVLGNGDSNGK